MQRVIEDEDGNTSYSELAEKLGSSRETATALALEL